MKNVAVGLLLGAGLVMAGVACCGSVDAAFDGPASYPVGDGRLITHVSTIDAHRDQLVVFDTRSRSVGVYHIDRESGEILLRSVRNIHWDLQMEEFNSPAPKPREIRGILEQR